MTQFPELWTRVSGRPDDLREFEQMVRGGKGGADVKSFLNEHPSAKELFAAKFGSFEELKLDRLSILINACQENNPTINDGIEE
jgi:hypothetical protein